MFDFDVIKDKIQRDNQTRLNEAEFNYRINNCQEKGNLPALKEFCEKRKHEMLTLKKVIRQLRLLLG